MFRYVEDMFRPGMEATINELSEAGHVAYGPGCYRHGILMSSQWTDVKVEGVSAQDQLLAWINDNVTTRVVSTCQGVNCQETCPHVTIGEDALCS